MIGKLRGIIDFLQEDKCVIDVGGVGYVVFLSQKTADFLRPVFSEKKEVALIIETIVKEDAIELYGFAQDIEKIWFAELTKVQGVGAKMAMKILGFFTIEQLAQALIAGDVKLFSKVSGIGPKLAQRLAVELKDSPKKLGIASGFALQGVADVGGFSEMPQSQLAQDALSALENLGYKKVDALKVVAANLKNNQSITLENLITAALRELSKNKF